MDATLLNSILKGQYKPNDKTTYKIDVRNKIYDVDQVIRDLHRTIEALEKHVETIANMFDLETIEESL